MQEYNFKIVYRKGSLNINLMQIHAYHHCNQLIVLYYGFILLLGLIFELLSLRTVLYLLFSKLVNTLIVFHPTRNSVNLHFADTNNCGNNLWLLNFAKKHQYVTMMLQQQDTKTYVDKTLERLHHEAYWVDMAKDVEEHCRTCTVCQQSKLSMPQQAPRQNIRML